MAALRLAVLISGRGTNLQALIDACRTSEFPAKIVLVISNRPAAKGLRKAEAAGIETTVVDHKAFPDRTSFERELDRRLRDARIELVCLAGFMRLFTAAFVHSWHDRLINIHPSLLPSFHGTQVHEQVLAAGVRISGCTVHYVRPVMDSGPILMQAAVPVQQADDAGTLAARVLRAEHQCYPQAVRLIAEGRVRMDGDRAVIDDGSAPTLLWQPEP